MTRILQITMLFSLMCATALVGQLGVVDGQDFEIKGQSNEFQIAADIQVEMGNDQAGEFFWELVLGDDIPEEWAFSICDANTCYTPGTLICPEDKPNFIDSGNKLKFSIYLNPNGVPGGIYNSTLKLFSVADGSVVFVEPTITWDVELASSVDDLDSSVEFTLYPNPTSDYFNITNDENVAQVSVYSVLGKEMFTFNHEVGQAYSVSDLDAGFYLARLIDDKGKSLKVIRFNKNSKN